VTFTERQKSLLLDALSCLYGSITMYEFDDPNDRREQDNTVWEISELQEMLR
jgi:hypothetical protein